MSNLYFKGDNIFLYTQFLNALGQPSSANNAQVRILHDKNGNIYEDLPWTNLQQMSVNEYFYNFVLPYNSDLGQYQVIYKGEIDGNISHVIETFHIINKSDKYENAIKIYGFINDIRTHVPLSDVSIQIANIELGELVVQSLSNEEGYWEAYIYPGDYTFNFIKIGFNNFQISAQIGDQHNEMQFNNIGLESELNQTKGNGIYPISDKYVTKHGIPLSNLSIKISSVFDPTVILAESITDEDGKWECFLDSGFYLLKVFGTSLNIDFNKKFRIKVDDNGEFKFEDLSKNTINSTVTNFIDNGKGSIIINDYVKNKNNDPIIDVQVNVFKKGSTLTDENIIAQCYTDTTGKWELKLDPGEYVIEFYHPQFKTITENRIVQ